VTASSFPESSHESPIRCIRFATQLEEEIAAAVPHLRGNFSGQVKHLVKIGLAKEGEMASPEQINKLTQQLSTLLTSLGRIGNNINQIAYQLNAGESGNYQAWNIEARELENRLSETNQLVRKVHDSV
jgi:uncharacterized protein YukE